MKYKDATGDQINELVKMAEIKRHPSESEFDKVFLCALKNSNPNYCANPIDACPIIIKNKISIMSDGDLWEASIDFNGDLEKHGTDEVLTKHYEHANPFRAAMIVYLMMQDEL